MIDLEETFIYDSVVHAYNLAPSNYRNEQHAQGITEMIFGTNGTQRGSPSNCTGPSPSRHQRGTASRTKGTFGTGGSKRRPE
jgi:hypothetical protein